MTIMLLGMGLLLGGLYFYQLFKSKMIKKYLSQPQPPITVAAMNASLHTWKSQLSAFGSTRSVQGVEVTAEAPGMIREIYIESGKMVKSGDLLVSLNADPLKAQLKALEVSLDLAQKTYVRDKAQFAVKAVSQQTLDTDLSNLNSLKAQIAEKKANIAQRMIRAPFSGILGISYVDLGQYLNPGDKVATLQTLDPIKVSFYLPQQVISKIAKKQEIVFKTDAFPEEEFHGKITTINPKVDVDTRNIAIEAIIRNEEKKLLPGMFGKVTVDLGEEKSFLTLPKTSISFNSYGEVVYVLQPPTKEDMKKYENINKKEKKKEKIYAANQRFVSVGDSRGDQISILKGLKAGETVVVAGQHKLKNGSHVVVDNTILPSFASKPNMIDE